MKHDIFISYSREDSDEVNKIVKEFESNGLSCWLDLDGIETGAQFEDVIIKAIDDSKAVVFMLSKNAIDSKYTKDEINYALNTKKKVAIVLLKNQKVPQTGWYQFKLGGINYCDYYKKDQQKNLLKDLRAWAENKPPIDPPVPPKGPAEKELPYFERLVTLGVISQIVVFSVLFVALLCTQMVGIGCYPWVRKFVIPLLFVLLLMIFATIMLKSEKAQCNKWCKWTFLLTDIVAFYLFVCACQAIYARYVQVLVPHHQAYGSPVYVFLNLCGRAYCEYTKAVKIFLGIVYFLHNAILLGSMYSRVIWNYFKSLKEK